MTWRTFLFSGLLSLVLIGISDLDRAQEGMVKVNFDPMSITISDMETALASRNGTAVSTVGSN